MSVASDSHSPFLILPTRSDSAPPLSTHLASGQDSSLKLPFLPTRSDSDRLILTLSDSVARLRFLLRRGDAGPSHFGNAFGFSIPDSCFCRGAVARPRSRWPAICARSLIHSRSCARAVSPRHPLCHRSALRAPHSTVTFERRLITRASEISWAVAWWSQSSARPILILGRRSPIPAGAWCRGLNGMPASDAAWRRPAATPQAVVGAAQRCSQRHVCSFAVGSAV